MIAQTATRPSQVVGPGAAAALVQREPTSKEFIVVSAHVVDQVEVLLAGRSPSRVIVVDGPTDIERAQSLARHASVERIACFIAVGGGSVLDLVKLASAEATNPRLLRSLAHRATTNGFLTRTVLRAAPLPFMAVPTTIGTGSEVNASACFESRFEGTPARTLVDLRLALPSAVAYDPAFTAATPDLLNQGIFEIGARIVGAAVGTPSSLQLAEAEAEFLFDRVVRLADGPGNPLTHDDDRIEAALVSAASHSGWALRGRGPAPSPLWLLSTELSVAASITKNEAAMRLVIPWLSRIAVGDERWGSADAFDRWSRRTEDADLRGWFHRLIAAAQLSTHPLGIDCDRVAHRVTTRFAVGSLANISTCAIAALFADVESGVLT